jgi:predicted DNA-binding protein (MmcQ/YjbR family)
MNAETIREYALSKGDAEESFPFGNETLVFKVANKVFLLFSLDAQPLRFNVKCDPEKALELRESYPDAVLPGYHMNKKHWNTIILDGQLPAKLIQEFINDSYALVAPKPKAAKKK